MQNLDQIRAAKALQEATHTTRQVVSKLPAMILSNGLLATAAFASEKKDGGQPKRAEMKNAMDAAAGHLCNPIHGIAVLSGRTTTEQLIDALSHDSADSLDLQRATAEALAFLAYLKRFTSKEGEET